MPSYDYQCEANQRTVEVRHRMNESIQTWGELCEKAGIPLGDTPANSPVRKLITGGAFNSVGEKPRFDPSILPK